MVVGCTEAWQACIEAWLELVEVRKQAWVETEEACKMALVAVACMMAWACRLVVVAVACKMAWACKLVVAAVACKMALVVAASSVVGVACMRDALVVGVVACMMDVEGVEHCSWVPEEEQ